MHYAYPNNIRIVKIKTTISVVATNKKICCCISRLCSLTINPSILQRMMGNHIKDFNLTRFNFLDREQSVKNAKASISKQNVLKKCKYYEIRWIIFLNHLDSILLNQCIVATASLKQFNENIR